MDPKNIDPITIAQFVVYTIVNIPINYYWQNLLEAAFPSSKPAPVTQPSEKKGKKTSNEKTTVDVRNTLIKFACDQTIGAVINIPLFIATIGATKGQGLEQILTTIQRVCQTKSVSRATRVITNFEI